MPILGHRLAFTQLLVAVGVNLFFVASTAEPAIGSRASIAIPNLFRALSHLTDLSPTTNFDSESLTTTDDNANINIASIATSNLPLVPSVERAPRTSAPPNLAHSSSHLATPNPATDFDSESLAAADDYADIGVALIAGADISSLPPTDRASRVSTLLWSVSGSRPDSSSIPDQRTFEHVAATNDANATFATAAVSIASTNTGVVVTSTSILDGSLQSDHHAPYHPLPSSDSTPVRLVLEHTRAIIADVSIFATNYTLAQIVASTAGDITRVFSSHHSTSIAISRARALASTADADGASNTDSTTAGSKRTLSDCSDRAPTRTYHLMDVKNSPKYKKAIAEYPTPGSHTGSATADSAPAAAESDADADSTAAAVHATAADLATAAEPVASRGSTRTFSDLASDQRARPRRHVGRASARSNEAPT